MSDPGLRGDLPHAARTPRRRAFVDYALRRRATLAALSAGAVRVEDVCDAHHYLLRAAQYHGEPAGQPCPVCRRSALRLVSYLYGDELGASSGRSAYPGEVAEVAAFYAEVRVYVVEVCPDCAWNHLTASYLVGRG